MTLHCMQVTLTQPEHAVHYSVYHKQVAPLLLSAFTGAATELAAASKEDVAIALAPAGVLHGTVKSSDKGGSASGSTGKGSSSKGAASKNANRKGKDAEEVTHHHFNLCVTRLKKFS
jgi:hypothetical protein